MCKKMVIFFVLLGIIALVFYVYTSLFFGGGFDKKYTREELTKNFVEHESAFYDLVTTFKSEVSGNGDTLVSLGFNKKNKVNLTLTPQVIDTNIKAIGGRNLEFDSPALDSALQVLAWTKNTLELLRDKMSKTNCNWIRTTGIYGNPIEVYPSQKGWGTFSYLIFDSPISDSLLQVHGKTISNSRFGSSVVLSYSSAL